MRTRAHLLLAPLAIASACSSSPSGSHTTSADGGTPGGQGGPTGSDGGAIGTTPGDSGSPTNEDGGNPGGGPAPEAGTTVTPGNGCAAALGIDAGFYTCSTQYFVSPTGSDSNTGTSLADALQTIGAATKLALKGGAA